VKTKKLSLNYFQLDSSRRMRKFPINTYRSAILSSGEKRFGNNSLCIAEKNLLIFVVVIYVLNFNDLAVV
jgi:hypothetical protein